MILYFQKIKNIQHIKSGFKKISNLFFENFNDPEKHHLLTLLEAYFIKGDSLFNSKHKPHLDELQEYINLSRSIVTFWNDTFEDFEIITEGPNIFCKKFKYLSKVIKSLHLINEISSHTFIYAEEDGKIQIEAMRILYCIIFSDEELIKKLPDCEYCTFEFIFERFFKILPNIRSSNTVKTNKLFSELMMFASDEMMAFLNRHKKIAKLYVKINPETGQGYFEL